MNTKENRPEDTKQANKSIEAQRPRKTNKDTPINKNSQSKIKNEKSTKR